MKSFVDLFCGVGGFRVALERLGLECLFSCDIDPKVRAIYQDNFGDLPKGDIKDIRVIDIPSHDVICAGFPCQPFSKAGNKNGLKEPLGRLFYHIVRICDHHRPKVVLMENVKYILSIHNGAVLSTMQKAFMKIGYQLHWNLINASLFGIPQSRERVYFVALRDEGMVYETPKPTMEKIYLCDKLEDNVSRDLYIQRKDLYIYKEFKERALRPVRIGIFGKGSQGERIYSIYGHAVTIVSRGGVGLYKVEDGVRRLSLNEYKSLMGFPDELLLPLKGRVGYHLMGNAVIPKIVEKIFQSIKIPS